MEPFTIIAICAAVITAGSFIGSTVSNLLFSSNTKDSEKIKTEIKVMSSEIKEVNIMEIVLITMLAFVIISIIIIVAVAIVYKKCVKKNKNNDDISLREIPRVRNV